jgi:hypothetical protein
LDALYIDPLAAHAGPGVNINLYQDVRAKMTGPLAALGEETGVATLLTRYQNKQLGVRAMYRGGGSLGIIGGARFGLALGRDPEAPERIVIAPVKCNIGPLPPALAFFLDPVEGSDHARVRWDDTPCALTADDILGDAPKELAKAKTDADRWLVAALSTGPVQVEDLERLAAEAGHSWRTLQRSKDRLGVQSCLRGFGRNSKWFWLHQGQEFTPP